MLIDCGEGTQQQLRKFNAPFQRINHILISHLHGDHFYGLPGLLGTMSLLGRTSGVQLYGPPELMEILSVIFRASETKLNFKEYKYLNIIKCGYKIDGLNINEIQKLSKTKSEILFEKITELNIPELRHKSDQIKKQLFAQKLKSQVVLLDQNNLSFSERKYALLDLALDKANGTSKRTIETEETQTNAHSKSYIQALLNNSLIDQYQDWSTVITQKTIITIYNNDNPDNLVHNTVQFGLIYIQKIIVSELISCLNLWVNENKFEYNLELSKYYMWRDPTGDYIYRDPVSWTSLLNIKNFLMFSGWYFYIHFKVMHIY